MNRHAFPRCLRLRDEIGEEDLTGLVRAKARQRLSQPGEVDGVGAEVGLGELRLVPRVEPALDDAGHVPGAVANDPPVRVLGTDLARKEREGRAALRQERSQPAERLGAHERCVAVDDERDPGGPIRRPERDAHGVAGPTRGVLERDGDRVVEKGAGGLALFREDDQGTGPRGADARDDVAQQRLAGDGMEDLRRPGLHPCPEARREHEGQRRFAHEMRSGWGARIRTWDSGSKVRRLTTWPRPTDPGASPPRPPTGTAPCYG